MRQYLGLVIGLVIGMAGAILFQQSLPPEEGSVEERLEEAEVELRRNERELSQYRAQAGPGNKRTVRDGVRMIAQDIRDGKDVSLDDLFFTMKPWLRDMSPLFERMRQVEEEDRFDSMIGGYSRKYNLSERDQAELRNWLQVKSDDNAREYREVIMSDSSGFVDFVRVSEVDMMDEDGIENFMETRLQGEDLAAFQAERLEERVNSVQDEANRRLNRLDEAVELDEKQLDEMFGVMARGSKRYQTGMDFDGMGGDSVALQGSERDAAIRGVLRPDQLDRYDTYQAERRAEAERDMRRVGLTLPENWELLDDDGF